MSERLTQFTIVEKEPHMLLASEATYSTLHKAWVMGCPVCSGLGTLAGHDVTYDEGRGLLTASPSILCGCGAHYFIEHNQIRWV